MKKYFMLFCAVALFQGCDDGDLTVDTINFDLVTASKCPTNNIIYKINGNETLLLEIGSAEVFAAAFKNDPTPAGNPETVGITDTNRVIYRSYSGDLTQTDICGTIPPAQPTVVEEWNATAGTIEITTTPIKTPNADLPGGERITGYKHSIILRNVTFVKPSGTQVYETFIFGDYNVSVTPPPFNTNPDSMAKCDTSNLLFNFSGSEAFTLDIDPSLIVNEVTPLGSPRTGLVSQTSNILAYTRFAPNTGVLTPEYFCTSPTPTSPSVAELWIAADGVAGVSGIVEVTTTTSGGFLHEVRLKNVTLVKGNSSFKLADDFLLGTLITN